jgi:integrase
MAPQEQQVTVGAYLEDWLRVHGTQVEASTWVGYKGAITRYLLPTLGEVPLRELSAAHLNPLYVHLLARGGLGGKPLSLRTVRLCHAVLHVALEAARKLELIPRNPADNATVPRRDPRPRAEGQPTLQVWSADQLRAFLDYSVGDPFHEVYVVAAGTGLRRGELLGLAWSDIDLDRRVLRVRQALSMVGRHLELKLPKTRRTRTLAIGPHTVEAFRTVAARQQRQAREQAARWRNPWDLVFTAPDGRWHDPDGLTRAFRRLVEMAPVPRIRLHDIRHTHGTLMLQAGVPVKVVSERLGHASVRMTLDVYAHVLPVMDSEAVDRFTELVYGTAAVGRTVHNPTPDTPSDIGRARPAATRKAGQLRMPGL